MRECKLLSFAIVLVLFLVNGVNGEDPYRLFTWKITYGDIYPLGIKQQVLLAFLLHCSFQNCSLLVETESHYLSSICAGLGSKWSSFFFFFLLFLNKKQRLWSFWLVGWIWITVAGDLDQWAISRASDRCCDKR